MYVRSKKQLTMFCDQTHESVITSSLLNFYYINGFGKTTNDSFRSFKSGRHIPWGGDLDQDDLCEMFVFGHRFAT